MALNRFDYKYCNNISSWECTARSVMSTWGILLLPSAIHVLIRKNGCCHHSCTSQPVAVYGGNTITGDVRYLYTFYLEYFHRKQLIE